MKRALTPIDILGQTKEMVIRHYDDDIRLVMYGKSVMELTSLLLEYHDKMLKEENTSELWQKIETLAEDMTYRYMPLTYINSMDNIELMCRDIMQRSQLSGFYLKCKKYRMMNNMD